MYSHCVPAYKYTVLRNPDAMYGTQPKQVRQKVVIKNTTLPKKKDLT